MAHDENADAAVELTGFTKRYAPSWWARNVARRFGKVKETVTAVDHLDLKVPRGQIMVLLGANGSGKSTTLEAISGLNTVTEGSISVDGEGGLGICPQRNVLWDDLTTLEHVRIFNRLKSAGKVASEAELKELIAACDLDRKLRAKSQYLSGGQKRKLQLSMMFTGGSRVCCVDECSSGVDALARQKLWNILLRERGARTIIFTTHFLDEADLLSDQIAILSKGCLKAIGSAVELKNRLGNGYRVHVPKGSTMRFEPEGVPKKIMYDQTIYTLRDSAEAAKFVRVMEENGIQNYEINSPTIEEIFFKVAEETEAIEASRTQSRMQTSATDQFFSEKSSTKEILSPEEKGPDTDDETPGLQLQKGRRISAFRQALALLRKRWTVLQRNYLPYTAAVIIPGEIIHYLGIELS
jgi:ABC-type multidrug transport system ATPase subunit